MSKTNFDNKMTYTQFSMMKSKNYSTTNSDKTYEFIKVELKNNRFIDDNFKVFACSNIDNIYAVYLPECDYEFNRVPPASPILKIKYIHDVRIEKRKIYEKAQYINGNQFNEEVTTILNGQAKNNGYIIEKMLFPIILKENSKEILVRYCVNLNAKIKEITISKKYINFGKLYEIIKRQDTEYKEFVLAEENNEK